MPGEAEHVVEWLKGVNDEILRARLRGVNRALRIIHDAARKNAPKSPSEDDKRKEKANPIKKVSRKPKKRGLLSRLVKAVKKGIDKLIKRKPRRKARATPGGLEDSIEFEMTREGGVIFVAANSDAGQYAYRIHNEKGKTWWNRGPGTRAKGPQADDKFIDRAVEANQDLIQQLMEDEIKKVRT